MYTVTQDERVRFMCERRLESEKTHIAYEEDVLKAKELAAMAVQKATTEEQKLVAAEQKTAITEQKLAAAEQKAATTEQKLAYLLSVDPTLQAKLDALQLE